MDEVKENPIPCRIFDGEAGEMLEGDEAFHFLLRDHCRLKEINEELLDAAKAAHEAFSYMLDAGIGDCFQEGGKLGFVVPDLTEAIRTAGLTPREWFKETYE